MRILVSAYACEPDKGSEPEVGWTDVLGLSQDHEVVVITRANNRPAIEQAMKGANPRFEYYDLPPWLSRLKRGIRGVQLYYAAWQWGAFFVGRALHRSTEFDAIHHVTFARCWGAVPLSLLDVPFFWGPVGGGERYPLALTRGFGARWRLEDGLRRLVRWLAPFAPTLALTGRRSVMAWATTPDSAEYLNRLGCSRVAVQPAIGVSSEAICSAPRTPANGPLRVVCVGRLLPLKAFHLALRAVFLCDGGVVLEVLGDGPQRARLESLARRLSVHGRITFRGVVSRDAAVSALREADVLLHPSIHESGGLVCLEAMSVGTPVVHLGLGGTGLLVDDSSGLCVDASTPQAAAVELSEALAQLCTDRSMLERLSRGAIERARVFTNEKRVEAFSAAYAAHRRSGVQR
jgi:glycosyltransferase involved in cell wall biosynthesis